MRTIAISVESKTNLQGGFTLVEVMLVITLFSLMMAAAYQSIVTSAQAKSIVQTLVAEQGERRIAHRTLQLAFSSGARIIGSEDRVLLDLRYADSDWLEGVGSLALGSNNHGQLHATADNTLKPTVLLNDLNNISFNYVSDGQKYSSWERDKAPDSVVLIWSSAEVQTQWWFSTQ